MGMIKNYVLKLLSQGSEEQFGQDAIEWAITSGLVHLSYELDTDIRAIMSRYDEIIEGYRRSQAQRPEIRRKSLAPMKRARPRRHAEASQSETSSRKRSVA